MSEVLMVKWQCLADAIWREIIAACEAYFLEGVTEWAGNRSAPEWSDAAVEKQIAHWNGYQRDSGAMNWLDNKKRDRAFDFESLPPAWQRAICERVWVLCRDSGLGDDPEYRAAVARFRGGA